MRHTELVLVSLIVAAVVWLPMPLWSVEFVSPYNSQKLDEKQPLLKSDETPVRFNAPAGFRVTLFAGEPDIRQPIAMTFDTRGRLWVAQNDTYAESKLNFDKRLRDAIIILSDENGDGKHDKRTVFWDQGTCLTSIELGYGGVYALCPPQLLFIPDVNGDDVPDGPVQVLLDGFDNGPVRHNIANGLKWGPDGWLYGRHGIQATSKVGVPGTSESDRVKINCGIWRFHPVTKTVEVVADGTTNSWGMDWDKHGEGFFINTVIGHLWHLIPGAHYRRMYGEDLDRHIYTPIEQHADHVHWATGEKWNDTKSDKGTNATSLAGGGHAHSGMMIYQGTNWPAEYRDLLYTINFHGRRLNREQLEREGSGYVGHHGTDLLETSDVWFRGIELGSGPDGGVYMLDWSDIGECHDHDGVHRSSGRVFKIIAGAPAALPPFDVRQASLNELVAYQTHADVWYARQARQVLQQRAAMGADVSAARAPLQTLIAGDDQVVRLRAMWALSAIKGFDDTALIALLGHADEHTRVWALRLLTDSWPIHNRASLQLVATVAPATLTAITKLAERETSAFVRLYLASTLQRLPLTARPLIATALLSHVSDADDHNLPLMLWYGVKDLAGTHDDSLLSLAQVSKIPLVRRYTARRVGENLATNPQLVERLLAQSTESDDGKRVDVLLGLSEALKGLRKVKAPSAWPAFSATLTNHPDNQVQERLRDLGTLFGDGRALAESRRLALDKGADIAQRGAALRTVIENRPEDLRTLCEKLIDDRDVNAIAAQGLGLFDDPAIAELLVNKYRKTFRGDAKIEVMAVLVSRPSFARVLLANLGDDAANIPKSDVTAFHARQIRGFNDKELTKQLTNAWGALRDSSEDKVKLIAQWKEKLTPAVLAAADRSQGRMVFMQVCSACHKLYGSGGIIGPDLTGAGRDNLAYLIDNIVDPSAVVGADFLMSHVSMKDGRFLSGVVGGRTPASMTLQTMTERLTLVNDEVQSVQTSTASLMPEGLLLTLSEEQVRNLIAYLMHPQQVPLPTP